MPRISVEPLGDGWALRSDEIGSDLVFRSGRDAENAAKTLGRRRAQPGRPSEITIRVRDGSLAGRLSVFAENAGEAN